MGATLYSFQFIPLNSIVKIKIHPTHSFKICKDLTIIEKLSSTSEIVEEIIKQLSNFLKLHSLFLNCNANPLAREEEDENCGEDSELSIEESEFMNKALEIFLTDESSTSGLTFEEENKKVGDLIPKTQKKAVIKIKFNILRGFSNPETPKGEELESDKPRESACKDHHEKTTHFSKDLSEKLNNKLSESLIIGDDAQKQETLRKFVEQTIGKTDPSEWTLLYRATRDGFGAKDFHSHCDTANRTLVVVKSTNGSIFGGFTTKRWNSASYDYVSDDSAFIFSILCATQPNRVPKRFSPTLDLECAIYCYPSYGPTFGGGQDTNVCDASNSKTRSRANLNYTYDAGLLHGSEEARTYLCGSEYFQTSEIEVYTM